ncbi:MAG: hypothetical protein E7580_06820 [Ruminococcaceae bacterium]|nr:hypothetical protein [Oscillospiraceae bacterium]
MKKALSLLLCALMLLPLLSSCASAHLEDTPAQATKEELVEKQETAKEETTEKVEKHNYPEIKDKLSWEKIKSFPIAPGSGMTTDQLRQLCADFFRYSKSALWTPSTSWDYIRNASGTQDKMQLGVVYGGLPYIGLASCSIYRLMDWYDEETGVVNMSEATKFPKHFGNQCSIASHWGWARVINSAKHTWTQNMTYANGFLRVGPYTYDETITDFSKVGGTVDICAVNGEQKMYESYAQLKMADGLVYYTTAGHVIMCTGEPVVVRNNGVIDGEQSYILITDQGQAWKEYTGKEGDVYQMKASIDKKVSFASLYKGCYLPFTFAEFLGTDPCEATVCTFDYEGESISIETLRTTTVTTNYAISDLYAIVRDKDGKIVATKVERAERGSLRSADLSSVVFATSLSKYCDGSHTVEVVCQLGTGERPTLYKGILTK